MKLLTRPKSSKRLPVKLSFNRLALLAAAAVLAVLLLVPPIVGVANNGDFERIMGTVGLSYDEQHAPKDERYFSYAYNTYKLHGLGLGGYVSSEIPVVLTATLLNRLLHSWDTFDIRFLGVVYAALFLTAFGLVLRLMRDASPIIRAVLAALFILTFCDIGYVAYYHSLYGEPTTFVFLLLSVAVALALARTHKRPSTLLLAAFFACAACLAASKVQTAPVGVLLALLGLRFRQLRLDYRWRRTWLAGTALLLLVSIGIYISAPREFKVINQYQTVFNGLLFGSADPERDLDDLGIDRSLAVLAGTNYFTENPPIAPNDPRMKQMFYERVSYGKIVWFYVTHPGRLVDNLQYAADNAMMIRPYYLGNYERSAAFDAGTLSMKFGWWSDWKKTHMPHSLTFLTLFFAGCAAVLAFYRQRLQPLPIRIAADTLLTVEFIAVCSFITPIIGDGVSDIGKHLFLFNVCFDVLAVSAAVWTVHLVLAGIRGAWERIMRDDEGPLHEGRV